MASTLSFCIDPNLRHRQKTTKPGKYLFIVQKCPTKQGKGTAETGKDKHINGVIRLQKAYG